MIFLLFYCSHFIKAIQSFADVVSIVSTSDEVKLVSSEPPYYKTWHLYFLQKQRSSLIFRHLLCILRTDQFEYTFFFLASIYLIAISYFSFFLKINSRDHASYIQPISAVLKNFAKLRGKLLCRRLFLIKLQV